MRLEIDAGNNRLNVDGVPLAKRTRWLAAFLQALVERGRHRGGGLALDELERVLIRHGREPRPLLARQVQRLVDGLREAFAHAGRGQAFNERFFCAPQGKTTGPWGWMEASGDVTVLVGLAAAGSRAVAGPCRPLPALAEPPHSDASVALAGEFKQVLAFKWDGQRDLAIDALRAPSNWRQATPELSALRQLKLGELLASRRDFKGAFKSFDLAQLHLSRAHDSARNALEPMLSAQRGLAYYAQQPAVHYQEILDQALAAGGPLQARPNATNPVSEAKRLNLLALCERRWVEAHRAEASPAQWDEHVDALLRYSHAALFLSLASEQFERAQNVCANLAYAHQQLARWIRPSAAVELQRHLLRAIEFYALSMSIHWRFGLPDNLTFQYIYLGELWLSSPQAREAFEAARLKIAWDGERPDDASFYKTACASAQELGDPRQVAYAALNKLRFGEFTHNRGVRARALKLLGAVLDAHPDLRKALAAEGYAVPAGKKPVQ